MPLTLRWFDHRIVRYFGCWLVVVAFGWFRGGQTLSNQSFGVIAGCASGLARRAVTKQTLSFFAGCRHRSDLTAVTQIHRQLPGSNSACAPRRLDPVLSCLSGGYDKVPQNLQNQTVDVLRTGELKQKQPWTVGGLVRKAWT